jgi:hypothetical protein
LVLRPEFCEGGEYVWGHELHGSPRIGAKTNAGSDLAKLGRRLVNGNGYVMSEQSDGKAKP